MCRAALFGTVSKLPGENIAYCGAERFLSMVFIQDYRLDARIQHVSTGETYTLQYSINNTTAFGGTSVSVVSDSSRIVLFLIEILQLDDINNQQFVSFPCIANALCVIWVSVNMVIL